MTKSVLLHLDACARLERSHTRRLTRQFVHRWRERWPDGEVIHRDIGRHPPPPVNEAWIAAAFARPAQRTPEMREALTVATS
jgi:FMN-dependent NADH-azoreductase